MTFREINEINLKRPLKFGTIFSKDVFIIGDNSTIRPPTGQKAKQEGRWLAKYFNSGFDDKYSDFKFKDKGKIIHTNDGMFIELCDKCTIWLPKYFDWIIYKIIEILLLYTSVH